MKKIYLVVAFFLLTALICGLTACGGSSSSDTVDTATVLVKMKASELSPSVRAARGRVNGANGVWAYLELEGDEKPIPQPTKLSEGYYIAAFSIRASANVVKASFKRVLDENPMNTALPVLHKKYQSIDTSKTEPETITVGAEDTAAAYVAETMAPKATFQELAKQSVKLSMSISTNTQIQNLAQNLAKKVASRAKNVFKQTDLDKAKQETKEAEQEITDKAKEIAAELEKQEGKPKTYYAVKLNCDGGTGALVNGKAYNESATFASGELITLTAPTKATFAFSGWNVVSGGITLTADAADSSKYTFTMPAGAVSLTAKWKQLYALTVNCDGGTGALVNGKAYNESAAFASGEEVTVNAGTKDGYAFKSWAASGITLTEEQKQKNEFTFTMPARAVSLTASWLKGTEGLEYTLKDDKYYIVGKGEAASPDIVIAATYEGKPVEAIAEYAFKGAGLVSITIPNSVTSIGQYAFYQCTGLTSVTIPNSVTRIGEYAFYKCTGLTSATIPNSVTSIGKYAFYQCIGLTSINIPNKITIIGESAFAGCIGLTSVIIPDSVTGLRYTFADCTGLTSVTIPDSVTSIYGAFDGCKGLTSINIPDSVTSIGAWTFRFCSGLTSINIPNNVTSIGSCAFQGCTGLTSINLGSGVTSIGVSAFERCSGLTSITIPNSVTSIDSQAFQKCTGLTSITIPNSVRSIGSSVFEKCTSLTSASIPDSITKIEGEVFMGCKNLSSITFTGTMAQWAAITKPDDLKWFDVITDVVHCSDGTVDIDD